MTKIARMYHERGIRQASIAQTLSISQAKVSRLLKRAEAAGIVRTTVVGAPGVHAELEEAVEQRYDVREVMVVDVDPGAEEDEVVAAVGAGGAAYLEATLTGDDRIGVSSWSQTVLALVDRLRPFSARGATEIVQLLGGVGTPEAQSHSNRILGELTRMLGAEPVYVSAPGVVANRRVRDSLLSDESLQQVALRWNELTMTIMGIGSIQPSRVLASSGNAFSPEDRMGLIEAGAVGDICHRVFRADGSPITGKVDDRIIAIPIEDLMRVPHRVGIAGGPRKLDAIRGALLGKWVTTLITDVETAKALVPEAS